MDRPNSSLIQFDSILMDINENPSNAENNLINNVSENSDSIAMKGTNEADLNHCNSSSVTISSFKSTSMMDSAPEFQIRLPSDFEDNTIEVSSTRNSDSGIHDSKNSSANIIHDSEISTVPFQSAGDIEEVESGKLLDITSTNVNLSNNIEEFMEDFANRSDELNVSNEQFHDAVQFFKDPSAYKFLEKAGDSQETYNPRSSLFMNFDPLHAKFSSQTVKKSSVLQEISEDNSTQELTDDFDSKQELKASNHEEGNCTNTSVVNKRMATIEASPRQSFGNILLSFDSPAVANNVPSEDILTSPKLYTEQDLQKALKNQELSFQEQFLKKQQDLEVDGSYKLKETEEKLSKLNLMYNTCYETLQEVTNVAVSCLEEKKTLHASFENVLKENDKLKEDLKTSVEDLQSVENTFSDFHKRYEQCKSMLKVYTQNENNFKQQIENLNIKLQEKEEMYNALQVKMQEMVDQANMEVANAKKSNEAQTAVLKAQLKKAELKITSLESDVRHIRIENDKLSSICDDLMAKVSEA